MRAAAIAVKPDGIGVGAKPEIFHLVYAGTLEPRGDVAGKIEHRVARARSGSKEAAGGGIVVVKAGDEIGPDLVIVAPDHRPDCRPDLAAPRAKPLHRRDGRFDDAGERPAPAGMRDPDHAGARIGK